MTFHQRRRLLQPLVGRHAETAPLETGPPKYLHEGELANQAPQGDPRGLAGIRLGPRLAFLRRLLGLRFLRRKLAGLEQGVDELPANTKFLRRVGGLISEQRHQQAAAGSPLSDDRADFLGQPRHRLHPAVQFFARYFHGLQRGRMQHAHAGKLAQAVMHPIALGDRGQKFQGGLHGPCRGSPPARRPETSTSSPVGRARLLGVFADRLDVVAAHGGDQRQPVRPWRTIGFGQRFILFFGFAKSVLGPRMEPVEGRRVGPMPSAHRRLPVAGDQPLRSRAGCGL